MATAPKPALESKTALQTPVVEQAQPDRFFDVTVSPAALALLVIGFIAIRATNLVTFCLDTDEVFSVVSANRGLEHLFAVIRYDVVHPPLSYIALSGWIWAGGESRLWVRLLPFLLSAAALIPAWIATRQFGLRGGAAILVLALLAVNDDQAFHGRYVRMYALMFLLSVISIAIFNEYLDRPRYRLLAALSAINLMLVYTHYYGWTLIAAQALYLIVADREKLKAFGAATAGVALLFLPWVWVAVESAVAKGGLKSNLGWIQRPGLVELLGFYASAAGLVSPAPAAALLLALSVTLLALGLPAAIRTASPVVRNRLLFAALAASIPPVTGFAISQVSRESVWGTRHLVISVLPFAVLLGAAIQAIRFRRVTALAACLFTVSCAWAGYRAALMPNPRTNYEVLVGQMVELNSRSVAKPADSIYFFDRYLGFPMTYHLRNNDPGNFWKTQTLVEQPPAGISGDRFWVVYNSKRWRHKAAPQDILRARGYKIGPGAWAGDPWDRAVAFYASK